MIELMTGARFRQWRESKGLSRIKAGQLFGVDRSTIWRWETDVIMNRTLLALAVHAVDNTV